MMNQEVKQKWIDALRSGEYQQSANYLQDDKGYCCLGVLCDLHAKEHGIEWKHLERGLSYMGHYSMPPDEVMDWAGLQSFKYVKIPSVKIGGHVAALSHHNDFYDKTFEEIATAIEEQL